MPLTVQCPFYKKAQRLDLYCEAGHIVLPGQEAKAVLYSQHCCANYEQCTLYQALMSHYDAHPSYTPPVRTRGRPRKEVLGDEETEEKEDFCTDD